MRSARGAHGFLFVVLLGWLAGCLGVERGAQRAGRGGAVGIAQGLAEIDPALRRRLHEIYLGDAKIQRAAQDLTRAVVTGAAEGLQQAQMDELTRRALHTLFTALRSEGQEALAELARTSGPALQRSLRGAISTTILDAGAALRQSATRDLAPAAQVLVRAVVDAAFDEVSRATQELGPLDQLIARQLAPAAGAITRVVMREAVLGLMEGMDQASGGRPPPLRALMREIGQGLTEGLQAGAKRSSLPELLIATVVALGVALLASLVGTYLLWRRYRRATERIEEATAEIREEHQELHAAEEQPPRGPAAPPT